MSELDVALLVTTYQRTSHLRRVLASIERQRGIDSRFEVVVMDDGSTDETADLVQQFRRRARFPVGFTTHPHTTFCAARCRNEGAAASKAPYLLFLDGDCVLPPDHVAVHLAHRKPGWAMVGDCVRLDEMQSNRLTEDVIRYSAFLEWGASVEWRRLKKQDHKFRFYNWLGHSRKPNKLKSGNVGIWRSDYEMVNGFDENYRGWGCEDDDLGVRLRQAGVRLGSILRWTRSYHLWHPKDPSTPARWSDGPNVKYFLREGRLTRCRNGLKKRTLRDLVVRVIGQTARSTSIAHILQGRFLDRPPAARPEVEILFAPSDERFSGEAECNILVALEDSPDIYKLARKAQFVVAPRRVPGIEPEIQFGLDQFDAALDKVA